MAILRIAAVFLALLFAFQRTSVAADACDPLKPTPPQNLSQEIVGKIDAKLSGLTGRLLNAGGNIEGTYKEASTDVLTEYPSADKLYLWDRTLYMYCITVVQSRLPDREKADRVEKIFDRIGQFPEKRGSIISPNQPSINRDLIAEELLYKFLTTRGLVRFRIDTPMQSNVQGTIKNVTENFLVGTYRRFSYGSLHISRYSVDVYANDFRIIKAIQISSRENMKDVFTSLVKEIGKTPIYVARQKVVSVRICL